MKLRIEAEKIMGDFSLRVNIDVEGERIGIFGESGSGKSTLVHLISGMLQPDKGEIFLDDDCLFSSRKGFSVSPEKRRIAIVFQQAMLFPHLSVKKNLLYGYNRCSEENKRIKPEAIINILKLQPLMQRGIKHLSGGEKQRVALGRAVLANPRLLIMDEPLSALDDTLRFQIIPYLRSVGEELKIPYLFERTLVVSNGQIVEETTPEQLARNRMAQSQNGYLNLLRLADPINQNGLFAYQWGNNTLLISDGKLHSESLFELSSREIILFKKHPEAISARNLLECTVTEMFNSDGRIGIVLSTEGKKLVAEIVRSAAEELSITTGSILFAAIKASSFRRLG
ncbi:MAG: molybdenum ABC transporter ATP-binding protein [Chlorobiales bacterium]|nr:molybdenum ABC transporter ATP-binding protein [Chlorobiales bacterium]